MAKTFFFYDLETSGLSPFSDRIMQFAGQRTDEALQPVGEAYNVLVKLNDDTLPSPEAIVVTGITPQMTQADGYTEAEFAQFLMNEIFTPDTTIVGFNSVRFDDEFIRHLLWRNFHDAYQWSWQDGRSRWDMLDVVRMTRALRPEGIEWPTDAQGNATNRLELLTKANGIDHENAHDALADVEALITVTKLIQTKQPQLFNYLFSRRSKKAVQELVNLDTKQPFVYVSGRYENEFNKATVACAIAPAPHSNVLVYDLRYDPSPLFDCSEDELKKRLFASWQERSAEGFVKVPVKQLQYNRCPAVAPLGVLEQSEGWQKVGLDIATITKHRQLLLSRPDFAEKLRSVFEQERDYAPRTEPEEKLYDGFIQDGKDTLRIEAVRNATANQLADFHPEFSDERLVPLLLHYKGRNFPSTLSDDEQAAWEEWRAARIERQLPIFMASLQRMMKADTTGNQRFVFEELQLWLESILPTADF